MRIPYWIQHADLSADDYGPVDLQEALRAFSAHDWSQEAAEQARLDDAGTENCPPGIGFVPGDGRILHICPRPDGDCLVYYHFTARRRILGFIPHSLNAVQSRPDFPANHIPELITRFFGNDHDWLLANIRLA